MLISTFVFLFFLFASYAIFLLASSKSDARHAQLQQRVTEALQESHTRSPEEAIKIMREDTIGVYRLVEAKQIEPDDIYSHPQRNLIYRSLGAGHKSVDPDV